MQSKIVVKEDKTGRVLSVPYWISKKRNLTWKIGETVYVETRSGYTMMKKQNQDVWIQSDVHTRATVPETPESKPDVETQRREIVQLIM